MEFFNETEKYTAIGGIPVTKFKSKNTPMSVYFADIDSRIINGYFCYGIDQPEGTGIETLLWQMDSSGGLFPRAMRSDIIRPSWQHHGAENPLADRDQSSFVTSALGETAFVGTFNCSVFLLQNIEGVLDMFGCQSSGVKKPTKEATDENGNVLAMEGGDPGLQDENEDGSDKESDSEYQSPEIEPQLTREVYFLSEPGAGAMGWEVTLQNLFPGLRVFWNRLLTESSARSSRLTPKVRECYDNFYRPENLTVIITGTVEDRNGVLEALREYEVEFKLSHDKSLPFVPAWSQPFPPRVEGVVSEVKFIPRNKSRKPLATLCFGWRGCPATDIETSFALKVFTAYFSVGPMWDEFISPGLADRVAWCQLEYVENCTLITIHGVGKNENVDPIVKGVYKVLARLGDPNDELLNLKDLRFMTNRIGWHFAREMENEPFVILASAISKGERYGNGDHEQIQKRINPRVVFDALIEKPLEFWKSLASTYFLEKYTHVSKIIPQESDVKSDSCPHCDTAPASSTPQAQKAEDSAAQTFTASSRRSSSRPRRNTSSVVQGGSRSVADLTEDLANSKLDEPTEETPKMEVDENVQGHLEGFLNMNPFPLGDHVEEANEFEPKLDMTKEFLEQVKESKFRHYPLTSYQSDGEVQHPLFPLTDMPFYTYLEDTETSFAYLTLGLDTTHLNHNERKLIGPITAALGAVLCPRPPSLDTDARIKNPTEFYPAQRIVDSQVSIGLNGEMMQSIFASMIIRPENYDWAVGMYHFLLYNMSFESYFLEYVVAESSKALGSNFKFQTVETPHYDTFDAAEINLHSIVKLIYKQESNARLFVGRRRLDLINEYLTELGTNPEAATSSLNAAWRKLVDDGKLFLQIGTKVEQLEKHSPEPAKPWKELFPNLRNSKSSTLNADIELMNQPGGEGYSLTVGVVRPSCFCLAIPINPDDKDFTKLCLAAQMFSTAQKWAWGCIQEEETVQSSLRMPCSYSSMLTLNLESSDVVGALLAMKRIMNSDWPWLSTVLIATKLMIVNDPASMETGAQGAIASALLAHLNNQPLNRRRDSMLDCLKVTLEEMKQVIDDVLVKFFDPEKCWYSLMSQGEEKKRIEARLKALGYKFEDVDLTELCTTL